MNIYVGQLPYATTADDLRTIFSEFGEIASLNLITDKFSGQSKGFAFVEMPNNSEADKAIKALNKTMFQGREIKVNQAEVAPREKSLPQKMVGILSTPVSCETGVISLLHGRGKVSCPYFLQP